MAFSTLEVRMNKEQYLLTKLAEECNEVAQMALKTQQFGMDEVYIDKSNKERLHEELTDLLGIVQMLNIEFGFNYIIDRNGIERKIEKVNKYLQYSVDLGKVRVYE